MPKLLIFGIFLTVWFTTLFALLPVGYRREDTPVPGQALSAPKAPKFLWKFFVNTVIAALITAGIVLYHHYAGGLE